MMQTFAFALCAAVAVAGPGKLSSPQAKARDDPQFLQFASTFNKNIVDQADFELRQSEYHKADNIIAAQNRKADLSANPKALRLKHNWTSDLTQQEYQNLLGLDQKKAMEGKVSLAAGTVQTGLLGGEERRGRTLPDRAMNVDHAADGFMHGVKDQGYCGSCWAFAATTALEGTLAKKSNTVNPVRYSEQQLVDCTTDTDANQNMFGQTYWTGGCNGGWMSYAWNFMIDQGVMLDSTYPYTGEADMPCQHDHGQVQGFVSTYGQITTSIADIKTKLEEQPLSVALDASSAAFQYYSSGVVTAADNCGTQLNHAVVMVGYTDSGAEPIPDEEETTPEPYVPQKCTVTKWWHTCEPIERRRLQDASGNDRYWKLQNSWGTWWGDNGFILLDIATGDGVCGVNSVVEWVDMA